MHQTEPATRAEDANGDAFRPYVPPETTMPEFTWQAIIAGTVLGVIFGASSLYLVLKVGLTVSASIPIAVLSITLFRVFSQLGWLRRTTILENNIVQTAGSAGESIAFGVGVTMPALLMLGAEMEWPRVMFVSVCGGLLGILMMIPLRRAFIVRLHGRPGEPGKLLYPEGTACAQVLITGEKGGTSGTTVFVGFALAFVFKLLTETVKLFHANVTWLLSSFAPLKFMNRAAAVSIDMAPELLGVGYIIGVRTAAIMFAGAVMGYLVIAPTIFEFGQGLSTPLAPATKDLIRDMDLAAMRKHYLLYVGAGCVAAAGIISMFRTLPMIARSVSSGVRSIGGAAGAAGGRRTELDLPPWLTLIGALALAALLAAVLARQLEPRTALLGGGLIVVFGFLFVLVSSRLVGEIGSTSNPISGMTIATLSITCLIFLSMGMTSLQERVLAMSIAAVVCIAASNAGATSQDLKTGFLVGGTPIRQQWAIIIGATVSALIIGGTLLFFNAAGTVYSKAHAPPVNVKERLPELKTTESYEGKTYHVLRVTPQNQRDYPDIEPGKYYVDESGAIAYLVDPAITGTLTKRDDGSNVNMKFEAPKTQVMALIVNGVLGETMNWCLVLMGAMIAVVLELCGIASLPFAVGVYVPMGVSAPIFLGGMARWVVESLLTRKPKAAGGEAAAAEIAAIRQTETSPAVLLCSGFVAGGTLAGALGAFLEFSPSLLKRLEVHRDKFSTDFWRGPDATLAAFGVLILLILIVGAGLLFRPPREEKA